jgi:hypothetical protein
MSRLSRLITLYPDPRVSLFYFAIPVQLIASAVSGSGFVLHSPILSLTGTFIWLIWIVLMFLVILPQTGHSLNKQLKTLRRSARIIFFTLLIFGLAETLIVASFNTLLTRNDNTKLSHILSSFAVGFNYNDGTAMIHQAINNQLEGKDPYATSNMVKAVLDFNITLDRVTMLRAGRFVSTFPNPTEAQVREVWLEASQNPNQIPPEMETKLNYPAGSFLLPAPFVWLGITDLRIVYLIIVLLAIAYSTYLIPAPKRFIFIGAALISLDLWNGIANGETGSLVFAFVLLAWVLADRKLWLSALFMGLAITTKQTAWFFLPFYLILVFKNTGLKRSGLVLAIVTAIFLVTNLPFMIQGYKLWFTSVFTPMSGKMFPAGVGIITLVTSGMLDIRSPLIFDIIEFLVLGLGIVWYYRYYHRYHHMGPLLAILPLFFAWRSLWPYFFYTGLIAVASILLEQSEVASPSTDRLVTGTN